jgi:hypothetical protein
MRRPATLGERRAGAGRVPMLGFSARSFTRLPHIPGGFVVFCFDCFTVWLAPLLYHWHNSEAAIVRRVTESGSRCVRVLLQIACYSRTVLQNQAILQLFKINNFHINQCDKNACPTLKAKTTENHRAFPTFRFDFA